MSEQHEFTEKFKYENVLIIMGEKSEILVPGRTELHIKFSFKHFPIWEG